MEKLAVCLSIITVTDRLCIRIINQTIIKDIYVFTHWAYCIQSELEISEKGCIFCVFIYNVFYCIDHSAIASLVLSKSYVQTLWAKLEQRAICINTKSYRNPCLI